MAPESSPRRSLCPQPWRPWSCFLAFCYLLIVLLERESRSQCAVRFILMHSRIQWCSHGPVRQCSRLLERSLVPSPATTGWFFSP